MRLETDSAITGNRAKCFTSRVVFDDDAQCLDAIFVDSKAYKAERRSSFFDGNVGSISRSVVRPLVIDFTPIFQTRTNAIASYWIFLHDLG